MDLRLVRKSFLVLKISQVKEVPVIPESSVTARSIHSMACLRWHSWCGAAPTESRPWRSFRCVHLARRQSEAIRRLAGNGSGRIGGPARPVMACFQKRTECLPRARSLGEGYTPITDIQGLPERFRGSGHPGGLAGLARFSHRVEYFDHPKEEQFVDLVLEPRSPWLVEQIPNVLQIVQILLRVEHVKGFQQRLELADGAGMSSP